MNCLVSRYLRFTPNSDHKSGHAPMAVSALSLKADVCGALAHVCYGPTADIGGNHAQLLANQF
jgi:hypothetical protein